ncbi:hypothetical protein HOK31_05660 [Candidatus Poribacteria bacterium]|nr:hypothetical protein [Candidatus Poribacteria bacterium]
MASESRAVQGMEPYAHLERVVHNACMTVSPFFRVSTLEHRRALLVRYAEQAAEAFELLDSVNERLHADDLDAPDSEVALIDSKLDASARRLVAGTEDLAETAEALGMPSAICAVLLARVREWRMVLDWEHAPGSAETSREESAATPAEQGKLARFRADLADGSARTIPDAEVARLLDRD